LTSAINLARQNELATLPQLAYFPVPVKKAMRSCVLLEGQCAGPRLCPLSRVQEGALVCIKQLATEPGVTDRLRELGFCEEQIIKLVARETNYICQVCNARLGISKALAESIFVEAVESVAPA
jgi:Fe2+ transport system protein FeoA